MPGPYPLATLAPTIDENGISAPVFEDIFNSLVAIYQNLYGNDIVLDNSTQDGQFVGILSNIINDSNSAAISVYNQYSPTTAVGVGLSSIVKTNGIQRIVPTNSTALMLLIGQPFTVINNGAVEDGNNFVWSLPTPTEIQANSQVEVTATCTTSGAIEAPAGTINTIYTPTLGWISATNITDAVPGSSVETDAALRQRQSTSTSIPAQTVMASLVGAVANIPGVTRYQAYENATNGANEMPVPQHTVCLVVEGGDAQTIGNTIRLYKTMGAPTFGNIAIFTTDAVGIPQYVYYQTANPVRIIAQVTLTPLSGFVITTVPLIQQAMSNWVSGIPIGGNNPAPDGQGGLVSGDGVAINDIVAAAKLPAPLGNTYKLAYGSVLLAEYGNPLVAADVALNFADAPNLAIADINIIIPTST